MGKRRRDDQSSDGETFADNVQKKAKIVISLPECARCKVIICDRRLQFELKTRHGSNFQKCVEESPEVLVCFFRKVTTEIEEFRGIRDYKLKVKGKEGAVVVMAHVEQLRVKNSKSAGPSLTNWCLFCHPEAPLYPGQEPRIDFGECILSQFSDQPFVRCSLDSKAKAGFHVTPIRHVETMSQLRDDELYHMWRVAVRALQHDYLPFKTMTLNSGAYSKSNHLLLKVRVHFKLHQKVRSKWSLPMKDLWQRLFKMAQMEHTQPKRPRPMPPLNSLPPTNLMPAPNFHSHD